YKKCSNVEFEHFLFIYSNNSKLHPLISASSKRPSTSNCPSEYFLPKSCVAIKEQELRFAKSIILIPPAFPSGKIVKASSVSRIRISIHGGQENAPFPLEYACESNSVIPYSE